MAKLTIGQKAERVVKFLLALRSARIAAALAEHGFTQADLDEGWDLLRKITRTRLDLPAEDAPPVDPGALQSLDGWENKWFAIAAATLKRRAPKAHDWVFRNLSQTEGVAVLVSVGTFVERWEMLDKAEKEGGLGAAGKEAKKILEQRGLTKDAIAEAKALLKKLGKVEGPLPDLEKIAAEGASFDEAETALWAWYLEWSKIARTTITQRSLLRQLGFLRTTAGGKEEEIPDDEIEAGAEGQPNAPAKPRTKKSGG